MTIPIVFSGGRPRGHAPQVGGFFNPAMLRTTFFHRGQYGSGFFDKIKSFARTAGKQAVNHVKEEAGKAMTHAAQGMLEGKDMKTALRDGTMQSLNNTKKRVMREVQNRVGEAAAALPTHPGHKVSKRKRAVAALGNAGKAIDEVLPPKRQKTRGKKKKKRAQRGTGIYDLFGRVQPGEFD